ncbi:MAG: thiol-activated cytolysin family protein [Porphyromonadaceae bacterium]|nr:thiol-activated cytolysin family protein [Porphyromonadaceae bacterium]
MMKKQFLRFLTASTVCVSGLLSSCDKEVPVPIDPNLKDAKPNVIEVNNLLRSVGKLEIPEDKPFVPTFGTPVVTDAGVRKNEILGDSEPHDKVVTPVSYDYVSSSEDFALLNPWPSVLWPGCLVQGESLYGKNVPATIPIYKKRKPGRIILQLVSGTGDEEAQMYEEVADMRESNVIQAQNKLLARYLKNGMPAAVSYTLEAVHSMEELAVHAGIDVNRSFLKLKASFGHTLSRDKNYMLVRLHQRFFTMSYEDPDGGFRGVFTDDITKDDLVPFTSNGNPICYISSVSYGRVYYLLVESSNSHRVMSAALNAGFAGIKAGGAVKDTKELQELKIKMVQLGGDAKAGLQGAVTGSFADVAKFITDGARLSDDNVGAPIAFTVKHLYDGSVVRMSNALKYSYEKVEFVPKAKDMLVGIHLKDITVIPRVLRGWTVSNRGHVFLKRMHVSYHKTNSDNFIDKEIGFDGGHHSIQDEARIPIYAIVGERTYNGTAIKAVTIYAEVEVVSSVYNTGKRVQPDAKTLTLERTFYYDRGRWNPNGDVGVDPYSKIKTSIKIGKIDFDLSLNFDFFLDSRLIRE